MEEGCERKKEFKEKVYKQSQNYFLSASPRENSNEIS